MPDLKYDVLGIGNAIVDVIARTEDDFLVKQGMYKGGMALIDEPRAQAIYSAMGKAVEKSGGSAANTIVGVAGFGARASGFVSRAPGRPRVAVRPHYGGLPARAGRDRTNGAKAPGSGGRRVRCPSPGSTVPKPKIAAVKRRKACALP